WYTHQTQNLARFTPHVGSSPTSGTTKNHPPDYTSGAGAAEARAANGRTCRLTGAPAPDV
ncbi:MAG TPA: hypothetical protein VIG25_03590, partial [Pyrinomonadaceae bacterium]